MTLSRKLQTKNSSSEETVSDYFSSDSYVGNAPSSYPGSASRIESGHGVDISDPPNSSRINNGAVWICDNTGVNHGGYCWANIFESSTNNWPNGNYYGRNTGFLNGTLSSAQYDGGRWLQPSQTGSRPYWTVGDAATNTRQFYNQEHYRYKAFTWKCQKNFFDVVTYTGNDQQSNTISHNLGSVPGAVIIHKTGSFGAGKNETVIWHKDQSYASVSGHPNSLTSVQSYQMVQKDSSNLYVTEGNMASVNAGQNAAGEHSTTMWGENRGSIATSSTFRPGYDINRNGVSYVAYFFADNSFAAQEDNLIKCGTFSITQAENGQGKYHDIGFEPQLVICWLGYNGFQTEATTLGNSESEGVRIITNKGKKNGTYGNGPQYYVAMDGGRDENEEFMMFTANGIYAVPGYSLAKSQGSTTAEWRYIAVRKEDALRPDGVSGEQEFSYKQKSTIATFNEQSTDHVHGNIGSLSAWGTNLNISGRMYPAYRTMLFANGQVSSPDYAFYFGENAGTPRRIHSRSFGNGFISCNGVNVNPYGTDGSQSNITTGGGNSKRNWSWSEGWGDTQTGNLTTNATIYTFSLRSTRGVFSHNSFASPTILLTGSLPGTSGTRLTVKHNLGAVPEMFIYAGIGLQAAGRMGCYVWHKDAGSILSGSFNYPMIPFDRSHSVGTDEGTPIEQNGMFDNQSSYSTSGAYDNSQVINFNGDVTNSNGSGTRRIHSLALMASKEGYSKVGNFTISGSGTFNVDCGIPSTKNIFIMMQRIKGYPSGTADGYWQMLATDFGNYRIRWNDLDNSQTYGRESITGFSRTSNGFSLVQNSSFTTGYYIFWAIAY